MYKFIQNNLKQRTSHPPITTHPHYSKDYLFLKKRKTLFSYQMHLFLGTNILILLGGKCLVQTMFIWSHTAYRRTYFIVFTYYNVINDMHHFFCLCFYSMHIGLYLYDCLWLFFVFILSTFTWNACWMFFYSSESF